MTESDVNGSLEDRLWSLLLESFADDVTVEGYWLLTHEDSMLPNFAVSITRAENDRPFVRRREDERSSSFAASLQDLFDSAYGEGHEVDGAWSITYASPDVPDWDVAAELDPLDSDDAPREVQFSGETG